MVGDDKRDETYQSRTRNAYPVPEQSFDDNAQDYSSPTDKDGGGIKIGDRRTTLQPHAREHAEGVDHKCQQENQKGRLAQAFGTDQPRTASQQERPDIQHHALIERLHLVEPQFIV